MVLFFHYCWALILLRSCVITNYIENNYNYWQNTYISKCIQEVLRCSHISKTLAKFQVNFNFDSFDLMQNSQLHGFQLKRLDFDHDKSVNDEKVSRVVLNDALTDMVSNFPKCYSSFKMSN